MLASTLVRPTTSYCVSLHALFSHLNNNSSKPSFLLVWCPELCAFPSCPQVLACSHTAYACEVVSHTLSRATLPRPRTFSTSRSQGFPLKRHSHRPFMHMHDLFLEKTGCHHLQLLTPFPLVPGIKVESSFIHM